MPLEATSAIALYIQVLLPLSVSVNVEPLEMKNVPPQNMRSYDMTVFTVCAS